MPTVVIRAPIDEGRLVGNGTHDQLLVTSGLYRSIVESQLGPLEEVEALFGAPTAIDGGRR